MTLERPRLLLIPSVPAWADGEQALLFDRKFHDGMLMMQSHWPGRIRCLMRRAGGAVPAFGTVSRPLGGAEYDCQLLSPGEAVSDHHLQDVDLVLASGDSFDQLHVSALCQARSIACVYIIEYTYPTRLQILATERIGWLRRLRRRLFLWQGERKRVAAFARADGLQANGTPAAAAYGWARQVHLYLDTRVSAGEYIDPAALETRLAALLAPRRPPLRLAYSGRLARMKGADHLIPLAQALAARGLAFELTLYGAGELEGEMRQALQARPELARVVRLAGVADFHRELLPQVQSQVDLFLIPHRQSDPSCTYIETLSCGVPIVGYDNEALTGILGMAPVGWSVPMDDIAAYADRIVQLDRDRTQIADAARSALAFASGHSFEAVFAGRMAHLQQVLQAHGGGAAGQ